jgi:hypothetical protein
VPSGAVAKPVDRNREVAAVPERSRQFQRASGQRADAAANQEGEGGSPGRRGE